MKKSVNYLLLLFIVVAMFTLPLLFLKDAPFEGSDGMAEEAITEIDPDYAPWFNSPIEPASGEIESLLFSLQAGIGAGFIGYFFGYVKGKRKSNV